MDPRAEKLHFDALWKGTNTAIDIREALTIQGLPSLEEKRILICSCGSGIQPVKAARAGAEVYAVDLSPVAVENALAVASHNKVNITCAVQDLHRLDFPDLFFDVVYGSSVLHHLDIERACVEFKRVLKPGGFVVFEDEPTFINPVIRCIYETAFGKGREHRRRSWLIFTRGGTDDEKPLDHAEFAILSRHFPGYRRTPAEFMFFRKVSHVTGGSLIGLTTWLDRCASVLFPFVRSWSYEYRLVMRKEPSDSPAAVR